MAATLIERCPEAAGCCTCRRCARANITVKIAYPPDGSVSGYPEVLNGSGDPLFATTAQSAISAVMECQRYDFMPPERYDLWKDITVNFNPNMMFGT